MTDVLLTIHSALVYHELAHTKQLLETFTKDTKGQGAAKLYEVLCIEAVFSLNTWWLIPLSKWVITPVINGISRVNPLITGVITHLLSGMSHQVSTVSYGIPWTHL